MNLSAHIRASARAPSNESLCPYPCLGPQAKVDDEAAQRAAAEARFGDAAQQLEAERSRVAGLQVGLWEAALVSLVSVRTCSGAASLAACAGRPSAAVLGSLAGPSCALLRPAASPAPIPPAMCEGGSTGWLPLSFRSCPSHPAALPAPPPLNLQSAAAEAAERLAAVDARYAEAAAALEAERSRVEEMRGEAGSVAGTGGAGRRRQAGQANAGQAKQPSRQPGQNFSFHPPLYFLHPPTPCAQGGRSKRQRCGHRARRRRAHKRSTAFQSCLGRWRRSSGGWRRRRRLSGGRRSSAPPRRHACGS